MTISVRLASGEGGEVNAAELVRRVQPGAERDTGVRLQFMTQADDRVRPSHAALHGTVWEPWDPDRPVPPLDFGCRCYLRPATASASVARETGAVLVKNPPQTPDESLHAFKRDAARNDTPVTNEDLFGKTVGNLVDKGELSANEALEGRGDGKKLTAQEALAVAGGVRLAIVLASMGSLAELGISQAILRTIIMRARKRALAGLSRRMAVMETLLELKPGALAGRRDATARRLADRASRIVLRVAGRRI